MKKTTLLLLFALVPMLIWAEPVEIDGIYYNLIEKGKIAEVTKNPNGYKGSVIIPDSVSSEGTNYKVIKIGESAFSGCYNLTSITIPNSVNFIGTKAFWGCSGLTSITIPNNLVKIEEETFSYCSGLTSITIPKSVNLIGTKAFWGCSGLMSITIPNGVSIISWGAFYDCTALTSINIPSSVITIENYTFYGCKSLPSITIPNSVNFIGTKAFWGCEGLTSITIPNSVYSIGDYAFQYCKDLTTITLPKTEMNFGYSVFAGCPNLKDVYSYADVASYTNDNIFQDSYIEYATLHVPASAINKYKEAGSWKNFGKIVALDGETPSPKCETPTISYENGVLKMACDTEGVEYVTEITNADVKTHYDAEIALSATYNISVYSTKAGYENSDVVTATLCWIDAEPKTEGITNGVANVSTRAVLIQNYGGVITVNGVKEGTRVSAYSLNGVEEASAISRNGTAIMNTNAKPGSTVIVNLGEKAVKVLMK